MVLLNKTLKIRTWFRLLFTFELRKIAQNSNNVLKIAETENFIKNFQHFKTLLFHFLA